MTTENTNQEAEATRLSIADLKQLAIVVDVAFRKGVFSADEAIPVSALYAKLNAFLRQYEKMSVENKTESDVKE